MVDRNALNLRWTFGFNLDYGSGALVDLTTDGRQASSMAVPRACAVIRAPALTRAAVQAVFYSVGHTGVIFDYEVRQQRLLQVGSPPLLAPCCLQGASQPAPFPRRASRGFPTASAAPIL